MHNLQTWMISMHRRTRSDGEDYISYDLSRYPVLRKNADIRKSQIEIKHARFL